jgi:DNA-binding transcriptional LysR family regulator
MSTTQHSASPRNALASIELRHLRLAIAAADQGSFRRAADTLHVRQSTLSRSIREFEYIIGTEVFERSSGGITPTRIGRRILRIAGTILEELDTLIAAANSDNGRTAGRLAIGFCTSLSAGNLRATLLEFREKFSQVELSTAEKSRARLARMLRNGALDIVVTAEDASLRDCRCLPLWSERILVALPKDHELTARDVLYWTDLKDQAVLLSRYDPSRELEEILRSKLVLPADRPRIENHDVSRGAIKALVSMRMGISLVLESDLGAHLPSPLYRELRDGTGPSRIDFSAFWRSDNENPSLAAFLKLLQKRYPSPSSDV